MDWVTGTTSEAVWRSLEVVATLTTEPGFQWKQGLLKMVNADVFIRAFIDKSSGQTKFQVYYFVRYASSSWAMLERVNYEAIDGLKSDELTVISRDVESCSSIVGCIHSETVAFNVSENILRVVADRYVPGSTIENSNEWKFRLKGKSGDDVDMGIVPAEVKGLLMAVDAYKAAKGLK